MRKPRILVVEDEKVVATDIEECLHKLGYDVVGTAASGAEAMRKAMEKEPDLALMDIKLRGALDGVDTAEQLHHRLGIPVVYLTAHADMEILERAKKTVPAGYVLKPFDDRALRSAVEIALYRHPIEKRMKENEQWLVNALRSIDEAVVVTQRKGLVTLMNRAAEALTGWKQEEAVGKPFREIFATVDGTAGAIIKSPVSRVMREGINLGLGEDTVLVDKQGGERWIQGTAIPLRDGDGKVVGAAVVFRVAGERARDDNPTPEQRRLFSRLETAGRLAGGIARDFRRILEAINSNGQVLLEHLDPSDQARGKLGEILEATGKGAALADRILDFNRQRVARPEVLHLNELVSSLEGLLQCAAGEGIELSTVLGPGTVRVEADPGHIEQVLLNLVADSREAMPAGGKLTIETAEAAIGGEYSFGHTKLRPGRYVLLSVSHTGRGMSSEAPRAAIDMAGVCEMIRQADGEICVYSEPGRVTTYQIYLPRAEETVPLERQPA